MVFNNIRLKNALDAQWVRVLFILISLIFIAGGAFNDGLTGWFWALPFFLLLFAFLPFKENQKILLCLSIFLLMAGVHHFMWQSSLVFPVIGDQVTLNRDLPTIISEGEGEYYFNAPDFKCGNCGGINSSVPAGVYYVDRIEQGTEDLGAHSQFVFSNGKREFIVDPYWMDPAYNPDEQNFCNNVQWEHCLTYSRIITDPMRTSLRTLTLLMNYPWLPFLLPVYGAAWISTFK